MGPAALPLHYHFSTLLTAGMPRESFTFFGAALAYYYTGWRHLPTLPPVTAPLFRSARTSYRSGLHLVGPATVTGSPTHALLRATFVVVGRKTDRLWT